MSSCSHDTRPVHGRVPEETARIYPGTPDADRSVPRKAAAYVRSKASRLPAGYAHWRPTGDAGTQPRS